MSSYQPADRSERRADDTTGGELTDDIAASACTGIDQMSCAAVIGAIVTRFVATQQAAIGAAADLVADALAAGGIIQAFGTGHSQALAMEIAGRAGGLVPTNRLTLRDPWLFGGRTGEPDPFAERDPTIAEQILDAAALEPADIFVIASNSGGNSSVVSLARLVRSRGHKLIAITSMDHTRRITSRDPSGKRLFEFADVVIDNCAPYGDTLLPMPDGRSVGAVSSITAAYAAQMLLAEVVGRQLAAGITPPIYLSANIPEGDEHNHELEERYAGRIRRGGF